jgi:hypothetical protein
LMFPCPIGTENHRNFRLLDEAPIPFSALFSVADQEGTVSASTSTTFCKRHSATVPIQLLQFHRRPTPFQSFGCFAGSTHCRPTWPIRLEQGVESVGTLHGLDQRRSFGKRSTTSGTSRSEVARVLDRLCLRESPPAVPNHVATYARGTE